MTLGAYTTECVDDAVDALGRLRAAWRWLAEARRPGAPGPTALIERRLTDRAHHIETEQVLRDRRAAELALRTGLTPAGPRPAPARLGPLRARTVVVDLVRDLAARIHAVRLAPGLTHALHDPAVAAATVACPWCAGTGTTQQPPGWTWAWPDPAPSCSRCGGWGRVCLTCATPGACPCDLADVVMAASLTIVSAALPAITDAETATHCAATLSEADTTARTAVGLHTRDHRVLKAPCPVCRRRDLRAEVSSPRWQEWSVTCHTTDCRCTGAQCPCRRPAAHPGRRHRWPARTFPTLAAQLGVPALVGPLDGRTGQPVITTW